MRKRILKDELLRLQMESQFITSGVELKRTLGAINSKTAKRARLALQINFLRIRGLPKSSVPAQSKDKVDVPTDQLLKQVATVTDQMASTAAQQQAGIEPVVEGSVLDRIALLKPFREGKPTKVFEEYVADETARRAELLKAAKEEAAKLFEQKREAADKQKPGKGAKKKTKKDKKEVKKGEMEESEEDEGDDCDPEVEPEEDPLMIKALAEIKKREQEALDNAQRAKEGKRVRTAPMPSHI